MHSRTPVIPSGAWFKSSYSGANTSECVEAASASAGTAVRDSKRAGGPQLAFTSSAWGEFLAALLEGQLD